MMEVSTMRLRKIIMFQLLLTAALSSATALAQNRSPEQPKSPLNPTTWGVVYDIPETDKVTLLPDVTYLRDDKGTQTLDIYLPPGHKASDRRPAVVFLNAIGDRPGDKVKRWEIYKSWPRLVAAHGIVGISMDADGARI